MAADLIHSRKILGASGGYEEDHLGALLDDYKGRWYFLLEYLDGRLLAI